jgi:hypothetical protein
MNAPHRRSFRVFLEWLAARENRLAEIGMLLAKAPPTEERDRLVLEVGRSLKAQASLCPPIEAKMHAHFAAGRAPADFDHGVDVDAIDAADRVLHEAALRLLPTPTGDVH